MEFMMSRAAVGMCGVIILAAAIVPVSSIYEDSQDDVLQRQADSIASMIDSFFDSDIGVMTVDCSGIIPKGCSLFFDGKEIVLSNDRREYRSATFADVESYGEYVSEGSIGMKKADGKVVISII